MEDTDTQDGTDQDDAPIAAQEPPAVTLDAVPGLGDVTTELSETVLRTVEGSVTERYRAVSAILYGPRGSGKRRYAKAIAGELAEQGYQYDYIQTLHSPERTAADTMTDILAAARQHQPFVLVLDCFDEIHGFGPVRAFADCLARIRRSGDDVVVIGVLEEDAVMHDAAANYLRHFDVKLELDRPDRERRRAILRDILADAGQDAAVEIDIEALDIDKLAVRTEGFGVTDLRAVAQRLVLTADPGELLTTEDVLETIADVDTDRVSNVRAEYALDSVETPDISFDDIGGLDEAKRKLTEQVEQSRGWDGLAEEWDISTSSGILLHGPPGNGKTMLARALANEVDHSFIPVKGPELKTPLFGQTEENIRTVFERAQKNAPAIVFFDEFDSLGGSRDEAGNSEDVVNTLLTELDGLEGLEDVVVIAATNRRETLDDALLRSGRFTYHVEVPQPDVSAQKEIFEIQSEPLPLAEDVTPEWFASLVDQPSGADIAAICERAATLALRSSDADSKETIRIGRDQFRAAYDDFQTSRTDHSDDSSRTFQ